MSSTNTLNRVLTCTNLPSLPGVGIKVLELTRKPSVSVEEIAKVVETDPALSAKVLKTVNSSLFGLQTPCTTIRRALGYLGLNAVKSIVLGFSLVDSAKTIGSDGAAGGFDMNEHWRRAIYAAAGARTIAQVTRAFDPEEAFTAALFQDIGSLAMFAALKGEFAAAITPAMADHGRHAELELKALGLTHMDAGAALASKWRLPERYVEVIRFHHDPDHAAPNVRDLVRVAALGTCAALTLTSANPAQELAHLLGLAKHWFGKSEQDVEQMLATIAESARELAKLFEKSIGQKPDIASIMEQANDELVRSQIAAQREAEELRTRNETLAHQATTDGLTGLFNRKKFDDELARMFVESQRIGRPFCLLMLDGDRFKSVNDNYGHHVGDAVLKELAQRIRATCGDRTVVCRYGGEEFAVLFPGGSAQDGSNLAERVRAGVESPAFTFPGVASAPQQLSVTVSVGVTCTDTLAGRSHATPSAMIEAADKALYQAKHAGRNRVCTSEAPNPSENSVAVGAPAPLSAPAPSAAVAPAAMAPAPSAPGTPVRAASTGTTPGAPVTPTRIMLIEDDALSAKLMMMLLSKTPGLEVEWIADGQAAIKRLAESSLSPERKPHVVISDLGLIGCDGLTVLKFIRSRPALAKIPFVVLTATVEPRTLLECNAAGATLVLSKKEIAQNLPKWIGKIGGELAAIGRAA